jgi:hypothetical protein
MASAATWAYDNDLGFLDVVLGQFLIFVRDNFIVQ